MHAMKAYRGVGLEGQSLLKALMEQGKGSVRRSSRSISKKDSLMRTEEVMSGPQKLSGHLGEEKNVLNLSGFEIRIV